MRVWIDSFDADDVRFDIRNDNLWDMVSLLLVAVLMVLFELYWQHLFPFGFIDIAVRCARCVLIIAVLRASQQSVEWMEGNII